MLLRSTPIRTLSFANSKSDMSTLLFDFLAARSAASLTRFARSAPVNPGVPRAISSRVTFSSSGMFFVCTFIISSLPLTSGIDTTICLSNLPGLSSAGSSTSGLLVAARIITPSFPSNPSISTSSWFKVCSRSS